MKTLAFLVAFLVLLSATVLNAQVKINAVRYSTLTADDQIQLKNFGTSSVDVSEWWFCSLFMYVQISTLTIKNGDLNIPPDGTLLLSGKSLNDTDADLGLYIDIMGNFANFGDPAFMRDFVQWGSGGHGRESVAMMAGLWTTGDFVPNGTPATSICYIGDPQTTPNLSSDWQIDCILVGVNDDDDNISIPDKFILAQNYPNPFNPTTTIKYDLPKTSNVILKIYNVIGQEIATLVNEQQTAGEKSIVWDGQDSFGQQVSSGVYIYRLEAGDFVKNRKMVLLK